MSNRTWIVAAVAASFAAGIAYAQFPIMNMVADKVIQKYQSSTCEQLWQNKGKQGPEEQRVMGVPQERSADAAGVLQQDRGSGDEQDVRLRDDSLMMRMGRGESWQ